MKTFIACILALLVTAANAEVSQVRVLDDAWGTFTIDDLELEDVSGKEMLHVTLSAYEKTVIITEDALIEEVHFFFPIDTLSAADYDILDKARDRVFVNPFKAHRRQKVAKRLLTAKTTNFKDGLSRGWHACTEETHSDCQGGVFYSQGPKLKTKLEVILK